MRPDVLRPLPREIKTGERYSRDIDELGYFSAYFFRRLRASSRAFLISAGLMLWVIFS